MDGLVVACRQDAPIPLDARFACGPRETLALVGPSGAGKTTLLRAIAGLARVADCTVSVGGEAWSDPARGIDLPVFEALLPIADQRAGLAGLGHTAQGALQVVRKHDVAAFHLLDPQEIEFAFGRPVRFVDMEGNTSVFVEPTEIADRYQMALQKYLAAMQKIVLETGLDYHRVQTSESYEQPLMRFLVGRTRARGVR